MFHNHHKIRIHGLFFKRLEYIQHLSRDINIKYVLLLFMNYCNVIFCFICKMFWSHILNNHILIIILCKRYWTINDIPNCLIEKSYSALLTLFLTINDILFYHLPLSMVYNSSILYVYFHLRFTTIYNRYFQ